MLLLSSSRFLDVAHGVPCPELLFLAWSYVGELAFRFFLSSSKIPSVDERLWLFDGHFGYPEVFLAKVFTKHAAAFVIIPLAYLALPLAGILIYLSLPNLRAIRRRFCVAAGLGSCVFFGYRICPAAGPLYLFGDRWPGAIPALAHASPRVMPNVLLNCAPSGHLSWALILFWFALRYCGRAARLGSGAFLALTLLATLGTGQHYLIDLIIAVPFAAALWNLVERQWTRAAGELFSVLAWLIVLRQGWAINFPSTAIWVLCAATLALPWYGRVFGWRRRQPDRSSEVYSQTAMSM